MNVYQHASAERSPVGGINPVVKAGALLIGAGYLLGGLLGFAVTGFGGFVSSKGHSILGFGLNPFHNLVHIVIGLGFIVASRTLQSAAAEGVLIGGGLVYLLAAIVGFAYKLPILAIENHLNPDNFLHLASALAAIALGLYGARAGSAPAAGATAAHGYGPRR